MSILPDSVAEFLKQTSASLVLIQPETLADVGDPARNLFILDCIKSARGQLDEAVRQGTR